MIIRLKTETKEDMTAALRGAGLQFRDEQLVVATQMTRNSGYFIAMCDTLYKPTGNILKDADGNEYPEKLPVPGYHANLVTNDEGVAEALRDITVYPDEPLAIIAGEG